MSATRTALSATCVCHSFAGARRIPEGDRRSVGSSRLQIHAHLYQGSPAAATPRSRLRSGRSAMKLAAAIDTYVLHRQAAGAKFQSQAIALRSFLRRYGNRPLGAITPREIKQFLDDPR